PHAQGGAGPQRPHTPPQGRQDADRIPRHVSPRMRTRREWIRPAGKSLPGVREGGPMRRVVICSPWRGDTALHSRYLDACLRDSYARGEAPFAPHAIGPRVLREKIEGERE